MKISIKIIPIGVASAAMLLFAYAQEINTPTDGLAKVHREISVAESRKVAKLPEVATSLRASIVEEKFEPSPEVANKIGMTQEVAGWLLESLGKSEILVDTPESNQVIETVKMVFDRIDKATDDNYVYSGGTANVSPPPGVPNAAAGMNPSHIEDPKLRREYLDKIEAEQAKNLKHRQQLALQTARAKLGAYVLSCGGPWAKKNGMSTEQLIRNLTGEGKSREALIKLAGGNPAGKP